MAATRTYYEEALRYIDNAEDTLKKAKKVGNVYTDKKYTKSAAGIAYAGIEKAAKWFIKFRGIKIPANSDAVEIKKALAKIDGKATDLFGNLYSILHIAVYYQDNNDATLISKYLGKAKEF